MMTLVLSVQALAICATDQGTPGTSVGTPTSSVYSYTPVLWASDAGIATATADPGAATVDDALNICSGTNIPTAPGRTLLRRECLDVNGQTDIKTDVFGSATVDVAFTPGELTVPYYVMVSDMATGAKICAKKVTPAGAEEQLDVTFNADGTRFAVISRTTTSSIIREFSATDCSETNRIDITGTTLPIIALDETAIGFTDGMYGFAAAYNTNPAIVVYDFTGGSVNDAHTTGGVVVDETRNVKAQYNPNTQFVFVTFADASGELYVFRGTYAPGAPSLVPTTSSLRSVPGTHNPAGFQFYRINDLVINTPQADDIEIFGQVMNGDGTFDGFWNSVTQNSGFISMRTVPETDDIVDGDINSAGNEVVVFGHGVGNCQLVTFNQVTAALNNGYTQNTCTAGGVAYTPSNVVDGIPGYLATGSRYSQPWFAFHRAVDLNQNEAYIATAWTIVDPLKLPVLALNPRIEQATYNQFMSLDNGFGIQVYGTGSADVPEFSLTTLLLATLLAGGLVLFVVRRRFK